MGLAALCLPAVLGRLGAMVDQRAEDAAKEVLERCGLRGFALANDIAEIIQRAIDDEYDARMQDAEGS